MRRQSKQVFAGKVAIGGGAPISVQSMLNVPASDIEGNVRQAVELERAGCEILRVSIPDQAAVALIPARFLWWRISTLTTAWRWNPPPQESTKSASIPAISAGATM